MAADNHGSLKTVVATALLWFGLLVGAGRWPSSCTRCRCGCPVCGMPAVHSASASASFRSSSGSGCWRHVLHVGGGSTTRAMTTADPASRRAFQEATLYTKPGCSPCEQALAVLEEFEDFLPEVDIVDIRHDSVARELYEKEIPVLELDGRPRLRLRITRADLTRLIAETEPLD